MRRTERIGIALDLTPMDETTLKYAGVLARVLQPEKLVGIHIVPVWDIQNFIKIDIRNPLEPVAPAIGKIIELLTQEVLEHTEYPPSKTIIELDEGRPYQKLKHVVDKHKIQLLVIGQKQISSGSGITSSRLARHIENDLLFVPSQSIEHMNIRRILVALDFSENAHKAYMAAKSIHSALGLKEKIMGLHVIDIPPYQQYGDRENFEYAISTMPRSAQKRFVDFMKMHDISEEDIDIKVMLSAERNVSEDILMQARKINADLIFIGAKGHSALENFFLGSVTESLITQNDEFPIWVVR